MLRPLFVTGRTCFLVCKTGHVAAVELGGSKHRERCEAIGDDGSVVLGVKHSSHNALPIGQCFA